MRFSIRLPPWQPSTLFSFNSIIYYYLMLSLYATTTLSQPQNIEVFFPGGGSLSPPPPLPLFPPPPSPTRSPPSGYSNKRAVGIAVGVTAAATLLVAGLVFFLISRCRKKRRVQPKQNRFSEYVVNNTNNNRSEATPVPATSAVHGGVPVVNGGGGDQVNAVNAAGSAAYRFGKFEGNLKGLIVDENGLDVVYWRKLEGMSSKNSFKKEVFKKADDKQLRLSRKMSRRKEPVQEIPLLRGKSSTSHIPLSPDSDEIGQFSPIMEDHKPYPSSSGVSKFESLEIERQESITIRSPPHPPSPPPVMMAIPKKQTPAPPPPPPKSIPNKNPPPPPPPAKSALKPPPVPPTKTNDAGASSSSSSAVKMKPLHWDKVNANVEHSMVWDKIDNGSFRFDGDMMEALFGYVATNRKSPQRDPKTSNSAAAAAASQVFILDSRKSQNIAIVLKSLTVSRQELIIGLTEGKGLSLDVLEKLSRIAPTKEEERLILEYTGDPGKLAFAESFLFQILRPVPTAFDRVSAMLFRSNYDSEVGNLKEMVKMVEMGCEELRRRGLFLKLLEAVLKAGNRMNAGTSRGNAQAFNLTALRKLSDVKSTDGKTTLLHFVVEEVVRSEGKRCALNRNRSLSRSDSSDSRSSKEEMEKDYMMLGLPIVGGLSSEFSNVKRAAGIDYDQFSKACGALESRITELQHIVLQCATRDGNGGFVTEMRSFVESAEQELKFVKEEQKRVTELVRRTTEYYQTGALRDKEANHFQLFVIIKDFLGMVDQVCIEIARNTQKRKTSGGTTNEPDSARKNAAGLRTVKFPNLPEHFMSEKSMSNSSDDDSAAAAGS